MRFPVKFNRSFWRNIPKALPSAADPRILCHGDVDEITFARAVSTFKFGATFKSTQKARFPHSILELSHLEYGAKPIILDVGASDGSTSLDVMRAIPFEKYYVTDLNIDVFYEISGNATWFFDEKGSCILMVTDKWVVHPDIDDAIFPFNKISEALFKRAPKLMDSSTKIFLINPTLLALNDSRISIEKHSIFETWPHEKADLIIAANILNRGYFTTSEITQALRNLAATLNDNGRIAVIDNRPGEKASIFQFSDGKFKLEKRINGGTAIEALVLAPTTSASKTHQQV